MRCSLFLALFSIHSAIAQTAMLAPVSSPEVLPDRRVVFRVNAPKTSTVSLSGDWMAPNAMEPMTRDAQGVWSITVGPLDPGLAIYAFNLDGVMVPDPVNPRIKLRARTSASLVDVPGSPPELWQARDVPHGRVEINWAASKLLGDTRAYYVYTPPGYDSQRSRKYPVLYLLHGNNDTAAGWTDVGKANFILDNLIALKRAVPMIVVMPWGHAVPYGSTQQDNAARMEQYLVEEVLPQVEGKYRASGDRNHRAVVGLSMGGGHAIQIGLGHLDKFCTVGAFSFAIPNSFETRFEKQLSAPETLNGRLANFWLSCGRQDPAFVRNREFAAMLKNHGVRHSFLETEGLHNYAFWRRSLVELAPLLFVKPPSAR